MAAKLIDSRETRQTDDAINRVLKAEQEARAMVEQCKHQASELVQRARERTRRIHETADQRIRVLRMGREERLDRAIRTLQEQAHALQNQPLANVDLDHHWREALEQLCDELIGSDGAVESD